MRVVEDYKPLDIESATMALALCRGIRARYPDWLPLDGDGGDENLKDYPIEENPELTIRSVVNNPMLYQEGWGVGKMKHSLTYSGGLSRSYSRTYAPGILRLRRFQPLHPAGGRGRRGSHPVRRHDGTRPGSTRSRARSSGAASRRSPVSRCRCSRSAASSTGRSRPEAAPRLAFGESAYREHFLSLYR